jgi:hypothetical protein
LPLSSPTPYYTSGGAPLVPLNPTQPFPQPTASLNHQSSGSASVIVPAMPAINNNQMITFSNGTSVDMNSLIQASGGPPGAYPTNIVQALVNAMGQGGQQGVGDVSRRATSDPV